MRYITKIAIVTVALAIVCAAAFAATSLGNDALSAPPAKITLIQAITTAEQRANGKASQAEYEHTKAGWAYNIEVVSGTKVFDVRVDAANGTVISSAEDTADKDSDQDEKD